MMHWSVRTSAYADLACGEYPDFCTDQKVLIEACEFIETFMRKDLLYWEAE